MKVIKHLGALALALVMALSALSGCGKKDPDNTSASGSGSGAGSSSGSSAQVTPMDLSQVTDPYLAVSGLPGDEVLARLGETDITAADYLYWLNRVIYNYTAQFGGQITLPWDTEMSEGLTFGQYMQDQAMDVSVFYAALREMAGQEGLTPDAALTGEIEQQFTDMAAQMDGDENKVTHALWGNLLTKELLVRLNENSDLYDQLEELFFGENSGNYPTDAEVTAYLEEAGRYRAKHILLSTVDDNRQPLDEETIAQKKATADDLLAQLRAAEDPIALFDELMKEHSEDPGLATNPEGYTTQKGEMVAPFEQAALALKPGEISDVVESDFGYHIILRMPMSPDDFRADCTASLMEERIAQEQDRLGVERTAAFKKLNISDFWDKMGSLQTAVQAELAG